MGFSQNLRYVLAKAHFALYLDIGLKPDAIDHYSPVLLKPT